MFFSNEINRKIFQKIKLIIGLLASMSFSILSIESNNKVFLKTMAAKQTNTMVLAHIAQMHCI